MCQPAVCGLLYAFIIPLLGAAPFWAPFFFCFGFLASRVERFCSLLAIATSLDPHVTANIGSLRTGATE